MGRLFDNGEVVDRTEPVPNFSKLDCEKLPKEWADADICKKITTPANFGAAAGIVAVLGMIECLFHKPGERLRTPRADFSADDFDQGRITSVHSLNR